MNLSPEKELRLPDPFHWTRDFRAPLGIAAMKERLQKYVDSDWHWSFLGPKPRKNYFGHIQENRFIIHNTPGLQAAPTIRLIGEWRDEGDVRVRIRFSWHSLFFLVFSFVALIFALSGIYLCSKSNMACEVALICLGIEALLCLIMFIPLWIEYRAAVQFLKRDIGLGLIG